MVQRTPVSYPGECLISRGERPSVSKLLSVRNDKPNLQAPTLPVIAAAVFLVLMAKDADCAGDIRIGFYSPPEQEAPNLRSGCEQAFVSICRSGGRAVPLHLRAVSSPSELPVLSLWASVSYFSCL